MNARFRSILILLAAGAATAATTKVVALKAAVATTAIAMTAATTSAADTSIVSIRTVSPSNAATGATGFLSHPSAATGAEVLRSSANAGETPTPSEAQVAVWRAAGPAALDGLIARYEALPDGAERAALADAIDRVAAQRYAYVSHLYWYTDLDEAEAAARAAGKPILSLRLLGRLDQDLSCANSRFFRVALYADPDLSRFLRERFVLHWSSERAVPRVTIDFGDGRRLETTVGGNSVHYVLDSGGRPVDALPGLWSAASFRSALEAALPVARKAAGLNGAERVRFLAGYHTSRLEALETIWGPDLEARRVAETVVEARANDSRRERRIDVGKGSGAGSLRPLDLSDDTLRAAAMTKAVYEAPVVRALRPGLPIPDTPVRSRPWLALGASRMETARLGAQSRALMRSLAPSDWSIDARPLDDESFEALVADFEERIAADSAMNESTLHRRIHSWLASPDAPTTLADLNERVYSELFLTPASDPWLGMATRGVFSGLPVTGSESRGKSLSLVPGRTGDIVRDERSPHPVERPVHRDEVVGMTSVELPGHV